MILSCERTYSSADLVHGTRAHTGKPYCKVLLSTVFLSIYRKEVKHLNIKIKAIQDRFILKIKRLQEKNIKIF